MTAPVSRRAGAMIAVLAVALPLTLAWGLRQLAGQSPAPVPVDLRKQTPEEAWGKSAGCVQCHQNTHDPHGKKTLNLGCCDCHGGDPTGTVKERAHVAPRFPDAWPTSANPQRSYTLLNHEAPEFVRFVNPGDLRVAHLTCGTAGCHA